MVSAASPDCGDGDWWRVLTLPSPDFLQNALLSYLLQRPVSGRLYCNVIKHSLDTDAGLGWEEQLHSVSTA